MLCGVMLGTMQAEENADMLTILHIMQFLNAFECTCQLGGRAQHVRASLLCDLTAITPVKCKRYVSIRTFIHTLENQAYIYIGIDISLP